MLSFRHSRPRAPRSALVYHPTGLMRRRARSLSSTAWGSISFTTPATALGYGYHEPAPFLHPVVSAPLEAGMVTSVEPGIYIAGWGGMRCEDNVLVTDTGSEM